MKEIQILLKLHSIKDFNEKLILRGEFQYYIEIFFSSTRSKSKLFRKYPQEKTNEIQINQTLSIKQYTGSQLEFWLRSESTDRVLGAFVIPFEQLTKNSGEFIEEEKNLCLSGVNFAVLDFCYQYF